MGTLARDESMVNLSIITHHLPPFLIDPWNKTYSIGHSFFQKNLVLTPLICLFLSDFRLSPLITIHSPFDKTNGFFLSTFRSTPHHGTLEYLV